MWQQRRPSQPDDAQQQSNPSHVNGTAPGQSTETSQSQAALAHADPRLASLAVVASGTPYPPSFLYGTGPPPTLTATATAQPHLQRTFSAPSANASVYSPYGWYNSGPFAQQQPPPPQHPLPPSSSNNNNTTASNTKTTTNGHTAVSETTANPSKSTRPSVQLLPTKKPVVQIAPAMKGASPETVVRLEKTADELRRQELQLQLQQQQQLLLLSQQQEQEEAVSNNGKADQNQQDDNDDKMDLDDPEEESQLPLNNANAATKEDNDGDADANVDDDEDDAVMAEPVPEEGSVLVTATAPSAKPAKTPATSPTRSKSPSRKKTTPSRQNRSMKLSGPTHALTDAEYDNLERLMKQFCRVPLLAEFSRPVTLLHPELASSYNKIISHPVDLGHVCRGIRRRQYKNTRDVRLDMWRVFANCVKFHSHPNNKEAVPSFVSIALHLKDFFNNLWQEYMLPSEIPEHVTKNVQDAFDKRRQDRKKNLENSGVLVLGNGRIIAKTAKQIGAFLAEGGRPDKMDQDELFGPSAEYAFPDLQVVVANLKALQTKLRDMDNSPPADYSVENLYNDLMSCCSGETLKDHPAVANRVINRLRRMFWKLLVPLHEANSRGVTQSSIWGNLAATIWARESSKKPFWPALCLGMLAPSDQREGWHDAVTERNEARLPEKLRSQLETAKRKSLQAQKRHPLSYFMVEFLGTHEFIWVRETDIVENFDPAHDPNKKAGAGGKKKRSRGGSSSVVGSKIYATALEECVWASEEYENVLQDAYDYDSDVDQGQDDGEEMNYSYQLLAQSDDEADDEGSHGYAYDENSMTLSDIDEANWLLQHEGMIDTSAEGRKNAKKRTQLMKKRATAKDKKSSGDHKAKTESHRKSKELDKKEIRELERRRKRRMKEREKVLASDAKKSKRSHSQLSDTEDDDRGLSLDKRARATAIVRSYLTRWSREDDFKSLSLNGVMALPAAMVDSTGLLGMSLAFRSAAGELPMPDEGDEFQSKVKRWTALSTKGMNSSVDRTKVLGEKIVLMKEYIETLRANGERRKNLAREAIAGRLRLESDIEMDEEAARRNHFKKKRKYTPKAAHAHQAEKAVEQDEHIPESTREEESRESIAGDADSPKDIRAESTGAEEEMAVESSSLKESTEEVERATDEGNEG